MDPSYSNTREERRRRDYARLLGEDVRWANDAGVLMTSDRIATLTNTPVPSKKEAEKFAALLDKLSAPPKFMDWNQSSGTSIFPSDGNPFIYNLFWGITRGNLGLNNFQGRELKPMRMTFNATLILNNANRNPVRVMIFQWLGPVVTGAGGVVTSPVYSDILEGITGTPGSWITAPKKWNNIKYIKVISDDTFKLNSYGTVGTTSGLAKDAVPINIVRDLDGRYENVCFQDADNVTPANTNYDPWKGGILLLLTDNGGAVTTRTLTSISSRIVFYNE